MRARLREESGFAIVGAMLVLIIMMGIGLALISQTDNQSNLSGTERLNESSFDLAEAALNAAALQLGRSWPTSTNQATTNCGPTTSALAYCPVPTAVTNGFTSSDYSSACRTDATKDLWQTEVRDNSTSPSEYWTTALNSAAKYDANGDNTVWVRSTSYVQCKKSSVVGLVSNTAMPIQVSSNVVTANWFQTTNQGKKMIVDTLGTSSVPPRPASQPAKVVLRCGTGSPSPCANYASNKGQITPPTVQTGGTSSANMLSQSQLQMLEQQAAAAGKLYASGTCPANNDYAAVTSPASGAPVVIQGPCNLSYTSNGNINTSTAPGSLIIENGSITLGGTSSFYGLLYLPNSTNQSISLVNIQGNAQVIGIVSVDGNGGISAGSSKTNLIYDQRASSLLKGSTGATIAKGTERVLPPSTP